MKFSIYLIQMPDGVVPMARDIYSEIWRGTTVPTDTLAKKQARLWAGVVFSGKISLEFVPCTKEKADEWCRRDNRELKN